MARQIEIEFEKGGKFIATLMEDKAPKTCKAVWSDLPIESTVLHSMYSGESVFLMTSPELSKFDAMENLFCIGHLPGDVLFNTLAKRDLPTPVQEIVVVYGGALSRDQTGWLPCNLFAKIQSGLVGLRKAGMRVREQGREKIWIKKK